MVLLWCMEGIKSHLSLHGPGMRPPPWNQIKPFPWSWSTKGTTWWEVLGWSMLAPLVKFSDDLISFPGRFVQHATTHNSFSYVFDLFDKCAAQFPLLVQLGSFSALCSAFQKFVGFSKRHIWGSFFCGWASKGQLNLVTLSAETLFTSTSPSSPSVALQNKASNKSTAILPNQACCFWCPIEALLSSFGLLDTSFGLISQVCPTPDPDLVLTLIPFNANCNLNPIPFNEIHWNSADKIS